MIVIFLVFLPLSLAANVVASQTIADWALVAARRPGDHGDDPADDLRLPAVDHAPDVVVAAPLTSARLGAWPT